MSNALHILLVAPEAQTPTSLEALRDQLQILAALGCRVSLLGALDPDAVGLDGAHYSPRPASWWPQPWRRWRNPLGYSLSQCLQQDPSIDIIHLLGFNRAAAPLLRQAQQLQAPAVVELLHPTDLPSSHTPRPLIAALNHASAVIVPTAELLGAARSQGVEKLCLITPGVDLDRFKPTTSKRPLREALGLPPQGTLVATLSTSYQATQARLQQLHSPATIVLIDADPTRLLPACDLYFDLTTHHTPSLLQALSCGLPVVVAPSPLALTYTDSLRCGLIDQTEDPTTTRQLARLLSNSAYRQSRAILARPYVRKHFSLNNREQSYRRLYQSL